MTEPPCGSFPIASLLLQNQDGEAMGKLYHGKSLLLDTPTHGADAPGL